MAPEQFQEFEKLDHCPGCGDGMIPTRYPPDVCECAACSLLFRNPRPTQKEIARSYDTGDTFAAWQDEELARKEMWRRRTDLLSGFRSSGKILDVGAGDGRFLQMCVGLGYEGVGTEISEAGASYAQKRGLDVRLGQILEIEFPPNSFDIATIWHVLEHVPNPGAVLRKVHSLLRPGGILAVAVPNEENYFVRRHLDRKGPSPFGPLQFGHEIHLTYFRPFTLQGTLRSVGFELQEFGVDDIYTDRGPKVKAKLVMQKTLARLSRWHFAVAMYAICKRSDAK
ncbi:MAG: class I SAM-dependent methyltransferase [Chthoniobacterales bacterium]